MIGTKRHHRRHRIRRTTHRARRWVRYLMYDFRIGIERRRRRRRIRSAF